MSTETLSTTFALLSRLCAAAVVLVAAGAVAWRAGVGGPVLGELRDGLGRVALGLAWLVAGVTTLGSLYYSEVADYTPCVLCWYQRICIYPLSVILGVAVLRRDVGVRWYAIPMAALGVAVSSYHTWLQAYPDRTTAFCTLDAPCTARYVWELGFVSLPFMALTAFLFVIAMLLVAPSPTRLAPPSDPEVPVGGTTPTEVPS